jgi:DNA-directed RNA polymerase beta' subunit
VCAVVKGMSFPEAIASGVVGHAGAVASNFLRRRLLSELKFRVMVDFSEGVRVSVFVFDTIRVRGWCVSRGFAP